MVRALAQNRSFAALWFGQQISWIGNAFHRISLLFLLMEGVAPEHRYGPLLVLTLVHSLAYLVIGPFAGVFADRWSRKATMVVADLTRAALVLLIPFAPGRPWLYALSFLVAAATLFFEPARNSALPNVVPARHLFTANSFLSTSESCAELLGLLAGGLLVERLGFRFAFYLDSLSFVVSAVAIAAMSLPPAAGRERGPWRAVAAQVVGELREGVAYVGRRVDIRALFGLYFLMAAALGSLNNLLALFATAGLGLGPDAYARMSGGIVAGYVVGSVVVGLAGTGYNRVGMLSLGLLGMGVGTVIMGMARVLPVAVLGALVGGLFNPVYYVASRTYLQEAVDNGVLGRVFSLQFLVVQAGFVASVALAAALLPRLGIRQWLILSMSPWHWSDGGCPGPGC
jgi:MFS family permease